MRTTAGVSSISLKRARLPVDVLVLGMNLKEQKFEMIWLMSNVSEVYDIDEN